MTKYYTMKECFDACGDDDIPYNTDTQYNLNPTVLKTKSDILENRLNIGLQSALSDRWKIKRAEPRALSAEEIAYKIATNPYRVSDFGTLCAAEGIKNGRLEEWLSTEQVELRKAFQKIYDFYKEHRPTSLMRLISFDDRFIERLCNAFENLKPPYERGK
jgi:hypothetical protein